MAARFLTVGDTLAVAIEVRDSSGTLADPGTGPTATCLLPDLTTSSSMTVTKTATGKFTATLVTSQAGRHRITWSASGANSSDFPHVEVKDVFSAAEPRLIIDIERARDILNIPSTTRTDDEELRLYIAATTEVLESLCGPLLPATRVETYDGTGSDELTLHAYPTAVTSVVEDGTTLSSSLYKVGQGGILWRLSGSWSTLTPGNIVVTYTVGGSTSVIPANVILAAAEQLRHLWQIGQIAGRPALGDGGVPSGYVSMGYAVPNRVVHLLGNHLMRYQGGGIH